MAITAAAVLSVGSGFCSTLSNVVISYPSQMAKRQEENQGTAEEAAEARGGRLQGGAQVGEEGSIGAHNTHSTFSDVLSGADLEDNTDNAWQHYKVCFLVLNLSLTGAATLLNILACGQGPVAVVFSLCVAAGLSSSLVLQQTLGLAVYDKNARVGTSVLVIAVLLIASLGPTELPGDSDVLELITTLPAAVFIGCSLVVMAGSMAILFLELAHSSNSVKLLLFALVGGTGTVLNASLSKVVQMHLAMPLRISLLAVYVLVAVICIGSSIYANSSLEDPSLFVPISNGVNLVLNCLAGICIWGDSGRLKTHIFNYAALYVLVTVGTYLTSSFDVFKGSAEVVKAQELMQLNTSSKLNSARCLTTSSVGLKQGFLPDSGRLREMTQRLKISLDKQLITHQEIAELLATSDIVKTLHRQGPYYVMRDRRPKWLPQSISARSFREFPREVSFPGTPGTPLEPSFHVGGSGGQAWLHGVPKAPAGSPSTSLRE